MEWIILESIFSFIEMLISCFFATGIFRKKLKGKLIEFAIILFSIFGTAFLMLREYVFEWIPDFVPAVLLFTVYAITICQAKWWSAVSWALVNYLFIGIISITTDYMLRMCLDLPVEVEKTFGSIWFFHASLQE